MHSKVKGWCLAAAIGCATLPIAASDFSAGGYHAVCSRNGIIIGLGDSTYGQLGGSSGGLTLIQGLDGVTDVAAGGFSTVALKSDGTVWFLGESTLQHTTPHGTLNPVSTPQQVAGLSGIDAIAAGHRHFLALDTDTGNLYAWGHNGSGQLGSGTFLDISTPVVILTSAASMAAGDGFSLAAKSDGSLWAWGRNTHGQLGLGDTADRLIPTQVTGITTVAEVAAGGQHALIRLANGLVLASGNNDFGQLGLGNTTSVSTPVVVPGLSGATALAAGYFHSTALASGGTVSVWGRNFEGQCGGGNDSPVTYTSPQTLTGLSGTPTGIACGYHFTIIQSSDGSFLGTGSNSDGQLDGTSVADQDDSSKILTPQSVPLVLDTSPPILDSTSPTNGASGISTAPTLVMTFDETVRKGGGNILIKENLGNAVVATIDVTSENVTTSGTEVSIALTGNLSAGTAYYLEVANGAITDISGNAFPGIAGSKAWSFVTQVAPSTGTIFISNHSFDADENTDADGAFAQGNRSNYNLPGGELTGWIHQSNADTGVLSGAGVSVGWKDYNPGQLDVDPAFDDGREAQALSLQSGASVLNTTSLAWSDLSVGDELILTIAMGLRLPSALLNWTENTFVGLTAGDADFTTVELADTIANSGVIPNNPASGTQFGDGNMSDVSFTYTVTSSDRLRSGNVGILLYSQGSGGTSSQNQAHFDNVRLDLVTTGGDFGDYMAHPSFGIDPGERGFVQDPDGDGLANGLEAWFGTHPGESNAGLGNISTIGTTTTFTHPHNESRPLDIAGFYEWSPNLIDWYAGDGVDGPSGGASVLFSVNTIGATTTVTATVSEALMTLFFRACVRQLP